VVPFALQFPEGKIHYKMEIVSQKTARKVKFFVSVLSVVKKSPFCNGVIPARDALNGI
jgi:hypothetical protein